MGTVLAKIDQAFLSVVLDKISVSGEKNWSGQIGPAHWSVTVKFTVTNIQGAIENDHIKVFAKVHVQAGPISYTPDVKAEAEIGMDGIQVLIRIKSLVVSVYVVALGNRIEFGNVDVCGLLPNPIEARFRVLPDSYMTSLPASLGGAQLTITVSNPQVGVRSGAIEASASLEVS
jgi:hypothetical protein